MLVHAWPIKTIRSCTDMKISKKHTQSLSSVQSLRPMSKLFQARATWDWISTPMIPKLLGTFLIFLLFSSDLKKNKRYFQGATFTSLKANWIVTIRRHLEPSLLSNSTGIKTRLVQKQWNWFPCGFSLPVLAPLPDPPQCWWQGPPPPTACGSHE